MGDREEGKATSPHYWGFHAWKGKKPQTKTNRIDPVLKEKGPGFDFHAKSTRLEPKRILAAHGKRNWGAEILRYFPFPWEDMGSTNLSSPASTPNPKTSPSNTGLGVYKSIVCSNNFPWEEAALQTPSGIWVQLWDEQGAAREHKGDWSLKTGNLGSKDSPSTGNALTPPWNPPGGAAHPLNNPSQVKHGPGIPGRERKQSQDCRQAYNKTPNFPPIPGSKPSLETN